MQRIMGKTSYQLLHEYRRLQRQFWSSQFSVDPLEAAGSEPVICSHHHQKRRVD
jgi:hypothetical protein